MEIVDSFGQRSLLQFSQFKPNVATAADARPALRATWCMRAYREFEGIYDVTVIALTQDRDREALLAQLAMQGVSHANAVAVARRFLEAIEWAR